MGRHSRKRISRPLIAALGITMVIGSGAYVHNIHKTRAEQAEHNRVWLKAVTPGTADVNQAATGSGAGTPATQTSSAGPTTAPAIIALAPPTTRPTDNAAVPASAKLGPHPLAEAKEKLDGGDLIASRQVYNSALASGTLSPADADIARHSLSDISKSVLFTKKEFKDDSFATMYQVQSGDRLAKIADRHAVTWELLCRINGMADAKKMRAGQWIKIPNGPFHCIITKSAYRLDVYLGSPGEAGSLFVTTMRVGLGKDNSTPTGSWIIQQGNKAHPATYYSPRGEGVIAADDPKNPLGGYWLGLAGVSGNAVSKDSYGIHGTIEPDSIGKQASMGCVRLGHDDIALLYDMLVDGKSRVVVKD